MIVEQTSGGGVRGVLFAAVLAASLASGFARAHDGDLDFSFGDHGKAFPAYPGAGFVAYGVSLTTPALGLQANGDLIVGATRVASGNFDFSALRLLPDGTVDTLFGNSGAAVVAFDRSGSSKFDNANDIILQSDDKIVLAGVVAGDSANGNDMGVARLNADGSPDMSFGNQGKVTVAFNLGDPNLGGVDDDAYRVALQADGQILLTGFTSTGPTSLLAVARLNGSDGLRDTTFNTDGRATVSFGGDAAAGFQIRQLADHAHILVVGAAYTSPGSSNIDFALAKLDASGQLDPSFGIGGTTTYGFDIGGNDMDYAFDFIEQPDGKLLVCGFVEVNGPANTDFGCMRFLADGTPDPAYAPLLVPFDLGGDFEDLALRMQGDALGRIVLVGPVERSTTGGYYNYDYGVARLLPDGTLDTTFGNHGTITYNGAPWQAPGTDYDNEGFGVLIQPDGKIVVAGIADDGTGNYQIELVRAIGDTIFDDRFE